MRLLRPPSHLRLLPHPAAPATALAAGASSAPSGQAVPASPAASAPAAPSVPDKFLVKGQDGAIDHSATALKVATEAYSNLERRLGSGEAPPASVDGYKINVPRPWPTA